MSAIPPAYARSTKRHLAQPAIDSFFTRRTPDANGRRSSACQPTFIVLPDQVQANLLSVGMRIRKAVPEGYRNGSKNQSNDRERKVLGSVAPTALPFSSVDQNVRNQRSPKQPSNLLPFCGIHSIGGLGVTHHEEESENENSVASPHLPTLGGSTMSADSSNISLQQNFTGVSNMRKRGMIDAEEEELRGWSDSFVIPQTAFAGLDALQATAVSQQRIIAQPRRRREMQKTPVIENDFGEAQFLKYDEDDMDVEY